MRSFTVRGKKFILQDEDTVLCPQDEKFFVSEALAAMADELQMINPRLAELFAAKAQEERREH